MAENKRIAKNTKNLYINSERMLSSRISNQDLRLKQTLNTKITNRKIVYELNGCMKVLMIQLMKKTLQVLKVQDRI